MNMFSKDMMIYAYYLKPLSNAMSRGVDRGGGGGQVGPNENMEGKHIVLPPLPPTIILTT